MKSRRQTNEETPTSPTKLRSSESSKRRTTYSEGGDTDVDSAVGSSRTLSIASGRALSIVSARAASIISTKAPSVASGHDIPPVPRLPLSPTKSADEPATPSSIGAAFEIKAKELVARKYAVSRSGRCYLKEAMPDYPFPCDTAELNRQTLKTMLAMSVLNVPALSRRTPGSDSAPTKVLEVGCGTALWSNYCHKYYSRQGLGSPKFFGVDIAPVSPNLRGHGLSWEFLQQDLTKPMKYEDDFFDHVMLKDSAYIRSPAIGEVSLLDECFRVLRPGGTLEIWESDLPVRCLLAPRPRARKPDAWASKKAQDNATYLLDAESPFTETQNQYLKDYNEWIQIWLSDRGLNPSPCTEMAALLLGEKRFKSGSTSSLRVAIPLAKANWESEPSKSSRRGSEASKKSDRNSMLNLTPGQAKLRSASLSVVTQTIESLEPILKRASGLSSDGWDRWWNGMLSSLTDEKIVWHGECLELGAWWGTKE